MSGGACPGVFETIAMAGEGAVDLPRHLSRMRRSCRALGLPPPPGDGAVRRAIADRIQAASRRPEALRLEWRGDPGGAFGLLVLPRGASRLRGEGARAVWATERRAGPGARWEHKRLDREGLDRALACARRRRADEVLFRSEEGWVCEGAITNVFWEKGGIVYTPSKDCGLLPGIARERMLEAARGLGLTVREGRFPAGELWSCEGAWLTNALVLAVPLLTLEDRALEGGGRGGVLERVRGHALRLRRGEC